MRKTPADLIDRFTAQAKEFKRLALVVVLGDQARLMWSDGPNLRVRLNGYIEAGGLPIGTIGYVEASGQLQFYVKVLEELGDIPFIRKHLGSMLQRIKMQWLESQLIQSFPIGFPQNN